MFRFSANTGSSGTDNTDIIEKNILILSHLILKHNIVTLLYMALLSIKC